jgi:hypothetical protein
VAIATVALFSQQILIAMRSTGKLAVSWMVGLAAAAITVGLAGGRPSVRVGAGFLVGEVVAFGLIIGTIALASRPSASPES